MGLYMINDAAANMAKTGHRFTEAEKEFVVQFAFKSKDKELTDKLIDELCECESRDDSAIVIRKYSALLGDKPEWIDMIENIIVALEQYRMEEEKAIAKLAELLDAYGIDVSEEKLREASIDEIRSEVKDKVR